MDTSNLAFKTFPKTEFLGMLRSEVGKSTIRIGKTSAYDVENSLSEEGFKVFPHLADVGVNESIRVFRSGTLINRILGAFLYPGTGTDEDLVKLLLKIKTPEDIFYQKDEVI